MPTAIFISPHLDDAAFSCGATAARLSSEGWRTVLATVFTGSVASPMGFALACQLDKDLPADVDYMALRRTEDREFGARAGVSEVRWLGYLEAPHRGYGSAPELFGELREGDTVHEELKKEFEALLGELQPEAVFVPQALGGHVDHAQVVRAVLGAAADPRTLVWYRDAPYAARDPGAHPSPLLPDGLSEARVEVSWWLESKTAAAAAYRSQLGFQFGGEPGMQEVLRGFAAAESVRLSVGGVSEVFLVDPAAVCRKLPLELAAGSRRTRRVCQDPTEG